MAAVMLNTHGDVLKSSSNFITRFHIVSMVAVTLNTRWNVLKNCNNHNITFIVLANRGAGRQNPKKHPSGHPKYSCE